MRKRCKKGQGALEYLMTYGWALLIIVVVGAALYALGVFNPPTPSTCGDFSYFTFDEQKFASTGAYDVVLYNGNSDITVTDVSVDGTNATTLTGNPDLTPSAGTQFTLSGTGFDSTKTAGDPFSYTVKINYDTDDLSGLFDESTCSGTIQ